MNRRPPRGPEVYTIRAGLPFVDALAAGILARHSGAPEDLPRITVLLPTRRACRSAREAFLRLSGGSPMLLPRLTPLGDLDEDELAIAGWQEAGLDGTGAGFDPPPAIAAVRRQLLLTRLVLALKQDGTTPDQAARLATELARLLDQVETGRLSFDRLADLVPEEFAEHWQLTLAFLKILTERWPAILAEEGGVDGARRRNLLLEAQARTWREKAPAHPVIAAGSTGSIPATADLLEVVAALPLGCVVLPGLDRSADAATWDAIVDAAGPQYTHPQYGMARLLARLGVAPEAVKDWPAPGVAATTRARAELINRALRPAAADPAPRGVPSLDEALAGVTRVDCPAPQEEAGVIALVMRQVLEQPGKTAALVTPDRGLARRVAAELRRWGVDIDDSAGQPLARTPPGAFLRLTARMAADEFTAVPLLAVLKHPLAAGGRRPLAFRRAVRRLEVQALRGPRPGRGIAGLRHVLPKDAPEAEGLLAALAEAAERFAGLLAGPPTPLAELVRVHVATTEALAATDTEPGAARLWAGDAGEALAAFVAEVGEAAGALAPVPADSYPALIESLMAGRVVRPRYGGHPRLHVWGLLEARLQHADVVVLGGLNEGTWPPEARANPWMSRPMMERFGLPLPERQIGLAAHDFAQAFSAPTVVLTRSTRVEGAPTVPSRWLLRLENLVRGEGGDDAFRSDGRWLQWLTRLDAADRPQPVPAPAPRPPVSARPRQLSVTRIETWIRDPYAVYARHILGLKPLDPLDAEPGAAERGQVIHRILDRFVRAHGRALGDDAFDELVAMGREDFRNMMAWPGVRSFWWPRFERIARWFVDFERQRRARGVSTVATEVEGSLEVPGPAGPFLLTARADRIDRHDGGYAIVDYKTGQAPSWPQVKCGLAPQLSLEAGIAAAGGFAGVAPGPVTELAYVRLSGGRQPGEEKVLSDGVPGIASEALEGLGRRIAAFDEAETPYRSRPHPMLMRRPGDYDHLARVQEWLTGGGDEE